MSKYISLFILFLIYMPRLLAQYSIENIPDPRLQTKNQYISDPEQLLISQNYDQINDIALTIDSISGVEYIVVVIDNYLGESIAKFSSEIFNKWEVGKNRSDNGLLLVVAKNRAEYDFVAGLGVESHIPYKYLDRIGRNFISPSLKDGDFSKGIQESSQFILSILSSPDPILVLEEKMPEHMPFWSFKNSYFVKCVYIISIFLVLYLFVHIFALVILKNRRRTSSFYPSIFKGIMVMVVVAAVIIVFSILYYGGLQYIFNSNILPYLLVGMFSLILGIKLNEVYKLIKINFKDEEKKHQLSLQYLYYLFIPLILAPIAWNNIYKIFKRKKENEGRFTPPDNSGNWVRIVRRSSNDIQFFLSNGQQKEEKLQSRRYEIWRNESNGDIITIPWDENPYYKQCPSCNYYTLSSKSTRVIKKATYSDKGIGVKMEKCENCTYSLENGEFEISQLRLKKSFRKRKTHLNNPNSVIDDVV